MEAKICLFCGAPLVRRVETVGRLESGPQFARRRFCNRRCHFSYTKTAAAAAPRFTKHVEKTESCWLWRGAVDTAGYGDCWFRGRTTGAHRVSWQIFRGEIPDGLFVLHKCDNPICVNPDHLFLGTHSDNMQDASAKGRLKTPNRWLNNSKASTQEFFS